MAFVAAFPPKSGVAPDSRATRQNGLSTVGQQCERTGSLVTCHSTTMECEIEAAIEWRVQERDLSSPRDRRRKFVRIQAGLRSGSNACRSFRALNRFGIAGFIYISVGNKSSESAYRRNLISLCGRRSLVR